METLHLFPAALATTRIMTRDMELHGAIIVPKGTNALVLIWTIQRKEAHYPDPFEFVQIDGFAKQTVSVGKGRSEEDADTTPTNRHVRLAFSCGSRGRAGYKFAFQEATTASVKNIKFSVASDQKLKPMHVGVVQFPEGGLP